MGQHGLPWVSSVRRVNGNTLVSYAFIFDRVTSQHLSEVVVLTEGAMVLYCFEERANRRRLEQLNHVGLKFYAGLFPANGAQGEPDFASLRGGNVLVWAAEVASRSVSENA